MCIISLHILNIQISYSLISLLHPLDIPRNVILTYSIKPCCDLHGKHYHNLSRQFIFPFLLLLYCAIEIIYHFSFLFGIIIYISALYYIFLLFIFYLSFVYFWLYFLNLSNNTVLIFIYATTVLFPLLSAIIVNETYYKIKTTNYCEYFKFLIFKFHFFNLSNFGQI